MQRTKVESSNLESIGYDKDSRTLEIEFKSGKIYQYTNVPEPEHQALLAADSIGSYFNKNIRNEYQYHEM